MAEHTTQSTPAPSAVQWWRLAALAVLIGSLFAIGHVTGLSEYLSTERIRAAVGSAGVWGPALLIVAFCVGEFVHVPGLVFVAAATVAYGDLSGGLVAWVGAVVSACFSFVVVRLVGGRPLAAIRWRLVRRLLTHLDGRPVATIIVLRLAVWMMPQLNYALALSNVRFGHYALGSAIGLLPPIAGLAVFFDHIFN